jgi:K(+)-stimulated pyrophosphate-energized sodium pump
MVSLLDPVVIAGLFIGAMIPFLFAALTMNSVGKAANEMIEEVRSQFRADPGILEGTSKPDYEKCVDISTKAALREMVIPALLAILVPVAIGILFGPEALGGTLAGSLSAGVLMAIMMANAGGAWDNAKKYVEEGHYGGKGSETHKATVVGDTVGDPFKDTSGPSMNILINLMTITAVVFAPLFAKIGGLFF